MPRPYHHGRMSSGNVTDTSYETFQEARLAASCGMSPMERAVEAGPVSIFVEARRVLMLVLVVLCGVTSVVDAQQPAGPGREAIDRGRTTYRQYCASCHGNSGRGDAPGSAQMKPRPTNLTRLTRQYGTCPAERIEATLKGTDRTTSHSSAMMVWRAFFLADAKGDEAAANMRVKDVTAFIASIQSK